MKYVLDTNICIFWLKGNKSIAERIDSVVMDNISTTIVNVSELYYGVYKSSNIEKNPSTINTLLQKIGVLTINQNSAMTFGKIKAKLEKGGNVIDDADILIASIVLSDDCILVTDNAKHFNKINGIRLENWAR